MTPDSALDPATMTDLWDRRWRECPPFAHWLRDHYPDRWVRFHSLPESKRYPDDEAECAETRPWRPGVVDELLRAVADDEIAGVILGPPDLRWLYHSYDGGADVIAPTRAERDALKERHRDWLSAHPLGL